MKRKLIALTALLAVILAGCGQIDELSSSETNNNADVPAAQITVQTEETTTTTADENATSAETSESVKETESTVQAITSTENNKETQTENSITERTENSPATSSETQAAVNTDTPTTMPESNTEPLTSETPVSVETISDISDNKSIFERLNSLSYFPYTCDGLPEYILISNDGTVYQLNFSSKWVWRNGSEEAVLPDDTISWLIANKETVNLKAAE